MTKYIFITGGVVSSLGKGITAASLGRLLKARGLKLTIQKFDPYINYDPGTMGPHQHGEIFVTEDGAETDLDLGHYERFIDQNLTKENNITTGKVYWSVIEGERKGLYQGQTVQVIPHITDEIKRRVQGAAQEGAVDVVITEIGGTIGDIESLPFLEAIRQLRYDLGWENVLFLHVTLVPYLPASGELKTKPTQHSVKELRSIGIQPDIIICRTEYPLSSAVKRKIALFCNVKPEEVVENLDTDSIYKVPLNLQKQGLDGMVVQKLALHCGGVQMDAWNRLVESIDSLQKEVTVALVGKYVAYADAYLSVNESLFHAGLSHGAAVKVKSIPAEDFETEDPRKLLQGTDAILVPGGFGHRGIEGKIRAVQAARETKIPFFGLCLGMQCAVIEFARHVAAMEGAHSTEFDENTPFPVFDYLPGQDNNTRLGGTLSLGARPCLIKEGTLAWQAYRTGRIMERHRHRFEFNLDYRNRLEEAGLLFSGFNEADGLVEIMELPGHPWFVAVLFHPEFKSRPNRAHPLFRDFVGAALSYRRRKGN